MLSKMDTLPFKHLYPQCPMVNQQQWHRVDSSKWFLTTAKPTWSNPTPMALISWSPTWTRHPEEPRHHRHKIFKLLTSRSTRQRALAMTTTTQDKVWEVSQLLIQLDLPVQCHSTGLSCDCSEQCPILHYKGVANNDPVVDSKLRDRRGCQPAKINVVQPLSTTLVCLLC